MRTRRSAGPGSATTFGYTVPWVSRIMNSDAFQTRLAPSARNSSTRLVSSRRSRRSSTCSRQSPSMSSSTRLSRDDSAGLELRALEINAEALGYGARQRKPQRSDQLRVALPAKAADAGSWASAHNPHGQSYRRRSACRRSAAQAEQTVLWQPQQPQTALLACLHRLPLARLFLISSWRAGFTR